eukprot:GHVQ01038715.1.p1 GENE.GHVQ01038715.1~~GHVQ01038715.1.p1  ORF type:complete len:364 (-),score=39.51 GHVQ01038715.1:973-2064(-)
MTDADRCSAAVLDRLNSLLEIPNGFLRLNESGNANRSVTPHPNFRIFFTLADTSSHRLSRALRNRCFDLHVCLPPNQLSPESCIHTNPCQRSVSGTVDSESQSLYSQGLHKRAGVSTVQSCPASTVGEHCGKVGSFVRDVDTLSWRMWDESLKHMETWKGTKQQSEYPEQPPTEYLSDHGRVLEQDCYEGQRSRAGWQMHGWRDAVVCGNRHKRYKKGRREYAANVIQSVSRFLRFALGEHEIYNRDNVSYMQEQLSEHGNPADKRAGVRPRCGDACGGVSSLLDYGRKTTSTAELSRCSSFMDAFHLCMSQLMPAASVILPGFARYKEAFWSLRAAVSMALVHTQLPLLLSALSDFSGKRIH